MIQSSPEILYAGLISVNSLYGKLHEALLVGIATNGILLAEKPIPGHYSRIILNNKLAPIIPKLFWNKITKA